MNLPIFLMGFMGSGKSSFGKKLANQLDIKHLDLDDLIEQESGRSISEIFEAKGESYFRRLESEALKKVIHEKAVVSLGGGTPCKDENLSIIKENGTSLYLKKDLHILVSRLMDSKKKRPLIEGKNRKALTQYITKTLKAREGYYRQADITIQQTNPKASEVALLINTM